MSETATASRRDLHRWLIVFVTVLIAAVSLLLAHAYESQQSTAPAPAVISAVSGPVAQELETADTALLGESGSPSGTLLETGCILAVLAVAALAAVGMPAVRGLMVPVLQVPIRVFFRDATAGYGQTVSLVALAVSRT